MGTTEGWEGKISGELSLLTDGTMDWVGHLLHGEYTIHYPRSWMQRLFSWPWKPWCNQEVWTFQAEITDQQENTITVRPTGDIQKTLRRGDKRWTVKKRGRP